MATENMPARRLSDRRLRRAAQRMVLFACDAAMVVVATLGATLIRFRTVAVGAVLGASQADVSYPLMSLVLCAIWLVIFWSEQLYDLDLLGWGTAEYTRVVRAVSLGVVVFIVATYLLKLPGLARAWTVLSWALATSLVCLARLIVRVVVSTARRKGRLVRPTLLVGCNPEAAQVLSRLRTDRSSGLVVVGYARCPDTAPCGPDELAGQLPCLGYADRIFGLVRDHGFDSVVIAVSAFSHQDVARMIAQLRLLDIDVNLSAGLFGVTAGRVIVREASGMPLILVKRLSLSKTDLLVKRLFDVVVATVILVLGLPVWIVLALAIKLTSPGPVFFRQARTGRNGRPFMMLKFRSMRFDAPELHAKLAAEANESDGPIFKMKHDPRVTAVGRFMRKFSIDEFPQFINVLLGEMSVVGPRPLPTYETTELTELQQRRHEVPPGLTGMWQVSGRSTLSFDEMIRLDVFYIENWSVRLDFSLIARTIPAVLFSGGAY